MTNKIEILLNDQLLEVDMNDLQGNDDALIGILQKDAKNHHLFLEFALEYYKRRMNLEFEKFLLAGKLMNLPHKNDSFVLMLNTLACYYIENATRIKGTTNTLQGPFGNQRNSADLINQATQIINEVEQIKRNKFTFVLKANLLFIKGESDQTIPNLKAALNLDRNFIPALIGLANALFKKNDFKNALLHYQQILELFPDISPDVRIPIGICFYELDMVNEARDSDNANATMFLALLGLNQARTKSSETKKLIKDANAKILNAYKVNPRNSLCCLQMAHHFMDKDTHKAKVMAQAACIYSKCSELKSSALAIHGRILHSQVIYY
jgi:RNA polymerase-associated protein CTR9